MARWSSSCRMLIVAAALPSVMPAMVHLQPAAAPMHVRPVQGRAGVAAMYQSDIATREYQYRLESSVYDLSVALGCDLPVRYEMYSDAEWVEVLEACLSQLEQRQRYANPMGVVTPVAGVYDERERYVQRLEQQLLRLSDFNIVDTVCNVPLSSARAMDEVYVSTLEEAVATLDRLVRVRSGSMAW